jgi:hypothetical protein
MTLTISKADGIADVVASLELARVVERHLPIATSPLSRHRSRYSMG